MAVNDNSSTKDSSFCLIFEREEVVLGKEQIKDILKPSSEDDRRIFRNVQIVFVNFRKVFRHFRI